MSFDYSKSAASASRLLTKFGQDVTHTVYTSGAYDPSTGSASSSTTFSIRKGVLFDVGLANTDTRYLRGNLVESVDKKLLIDGALEVNLDDLFTVNGKEYQVVSIGELNPAGVSIMYDLHVRAR